MSEWRTDMENAPDCEVHNVVGRFKDASAGFPRYAERVNGRWYQLSRSEPEEIVVWAWRPRDAWPQEPSPETDTQEAQSLIPAAITVAYGERCSVHEPDCTVCRAWAEYDRLATTEPTPQPTQPSDWIPHNGGPMPVDGEVLVDVKHRDGEISRRVPARLCPTWWMYGGDPSDNIIAYRLSEGEPS